jgi:alpha-L-fucosidase
MAENLTPDSPILNFRQIHLDFHTSPHIPEIGADFDPEEFAATLEKARVNSVTAFARCHHGYIYFDSKKHPERIHPHLANKDLLKEQIEACHKRGIRVPIYITVQWDQYSADKHREWLSLDAEGREFGTKPLTPGFYRFLDVFHPGYRQFLYDHVEEVLTTLPTDGIFFDIVQARPSLAAHWMDAMAAAGIDPTDENARQKFSQKVIQDWEQEMTAFIRRFNTDCTIFYNSGHVGPRHRLAREAYTHYELESLPSGGWGYLHFPQAMRYARTLQRDCMGMTGKFHTSWGDFGSYKNQAALEFECFHMLALGAKCSIGD